MIALELCKKETGEYPRQLTAVRAYVRESFPALDPWGREFMYKHPGEHGVRPDLKSLGPDGQESGDDVVSWQ